MPPQKTSLYRLLVEGTDDQWVIVNLMARHGYDWDDTSRQRPFIEQTSGVEHLLSQKLLSASAKTHQRLGLVLDADLDPIDRWGQVQSNFRALGISLPSSPDPNGMVIPVSASAQGFKLQRLGVWLMPDNTVPGILENFLAKLVPSTSSCWSYAQMAVQQACDQYQAPLESKDIAKGEIFTWLAWQKEPGLPFGTAIKAAVFGHDSPEAQRFVDWFKRLFIDT